MTTRKPWMNPSAGGGAVAAALLAMALVAQGQASGLQDKGASQPAAAGTNGMNGWDGYFLPDKGATQPTAPASDPPPANTAFQDKATGDWWGERQRLLDAGIAINGSLVLEGFNNFQGGLNDSKLLGASTFDLNLSLDTEKALDWQGGKFYVDLEDHAGDNPTASQVGDLQVFDKLNSAPYLQVFELWYQQLLFDDRLRLKIGKVDANTEFSVVENGLPFLNSSSQVSPTLFVLPTTPAPMPGVNVFFSPVRSYYAGFGAYYANRSEGFGNFTGHPQATMATQFGTFLIGEMGWRWRDAPVFNEAGNFKLGAWWHTGTFDRLDGGQQRGTGGYYVIFNQTLWKPAGATDPGRGVRTFLEHGGTQSTISTIDSHVGGGVTWTGFLAARPEDIVGTCAQYAHIPADAALPYSYELAVEGFYRLQLLKWAVLMPDLQYIVHPGGEHPNAVVGTLRLMVNF